MRTTTIFATLISLLASACAPAAELDDEAGVTTVMSDGDESSTTDADTTTGTESSASTAITSAGGFLDGLDVPTDPVACDVWTQDCPVGEKCVPFASGGADYNEYKCVPILGDQAPGEPCTSDGMLAATDDCDASSICFDGTCHAQCTGSDSMPSCPEGSTCHISGSSTLVLCFASCDPLLQDCEPGLGCYWGGANFGCYPPTEGIPLGEPCGYVNDCAPGHLCADAAALPSCGGSACCAAYCDVSDGNAMCEVPGTVCVPFFEQGEAPGGYESVGLCILPP